MHCIFLFILKIIIKITIIINDVLFEKNRNYEIAEYVFDFIEVEN